MIQRTNSNEADTPAIIQEMHMLTSIGCRCTFFAVKKVRTRIGRPTLPETIWKTSQMVRIPWPFSALGPVMALAISATHHHVNFHAITSYANNAPSTEFPALPSIVKK